MPHREEFTWGSMTWMLSGPQAEACGFSVAVMQIGPGKAAERHRHPNASEYLLVTAGGITLDLGGSEIMLRVGEGHLIPAGEPHRVASGQVGASLTLTYSHPHRVYERL